MSEAVARGEKTARQRLYDTIEGVLGVPPGTVVETSSPETLPSWDSLNHLNLAVAIEGEFSVTFSPQDVIDMRNVGLIQTILREYGIDAS